MLEELERSTDALLVVQFAVTNAEELARSEDDCMRSLGAASSLRETNPSHFGLDGFELLL